MTTIPADRARAARLGRRAGSTAAAFLLAVFGLAVIGFIGLIEWAAIFSLATGAGDWAHVLLYSVAAAALPIALPWGGQGLAELHRARLREMRELDIARPTTDNSWWPLGPWRSGTTWRAVGYHVVAPLIGPVGRWDAWAAHRLLGPETGR